MFTILIKNLIYLGVLIGLNLNLCLAQTTFGTLAGTQGGSTNSYFGLRAGHLNTESSNSFFGYHSGRYNNANYNSFFGAYAGYKNEDGSENTFIGMGTGYYNTSGSNNSLIGYRSGRNNTLGSNNCFLGSYSGYYNTHGSNNSFLGSEAGYSNQEGYGNTFIGVKTGKQATGSLNVFIGFEAGYYETANNKLYIDNSSTYNPLISGDFDADHLKINGTFEVASTTGSTTFKNIEHTHEGITEDFISINVTEETGSNVLISETGRISIGSNDICLRHTANNDTTYLIVDGAAVKYGDPFWYSASDKRLKKSINPLQNNLHKFLDINFYSYQYKKNSQYRYGILAQEMENIFPNSIGKLTKEDGSEYLTFNPNDLFYTGLKVTQEIGELTLEQKAKIDQLEKENAVIKTELEAIKNALINYGVNITQNINNSVLKEDVPHLFQNKPNPFNKKTTIKYFLPVGINEAHFVIYDLNGKTIEKRNLPITKGYETLDLSLMENYLNNIYYYSLYVDGQLVDTKKMLAN